MTTFVQLAKDKKPEDFKAAVVAELNHRLQSTINDMRDEMTVEIFGEELVNKHDKTEDKKTKETSYRCYSRILYLGDNADAGRTKASFKNGTLSVEIRKAEGKKKVTDIKVE